MPHDIELWLQNVSVKSKAPLPVPPPDEPTPKYIFEGHGRTIRDFVFLHDNIHIVSGSEDGTMRKWDCNAGLLVGEPWKGGGGRIYALALSPDGKTIACGRADGSVQRWTSDGKMLKGLWTGHSDWVRSLSWSPSGRHIASGSDDGTILIRKVESGKVEVGPIKTKQYWVCSLAYSPLGDRIASGGWNKTICIWNIKTSELVIGPIHDMGYDVTSLVWSSDSTKLYSASDKFARVFDSISGALLHRFQHNDLLYSVALSPIHNYVLVCVGDQGIAQLWDTKSGRRLGQPFRHDRQILRCVSFSQDGRYIACGGHDRKLTLWMVEDIAPQLSIIKEVLNNPYDKIYQSPLPSLTSVSESSAPHHPHLSTARRFWNIICRHRTPANESIPQGHLKRGFFARRARSNSAPELTPITPSQPTPNWKVRAGEEEEEDEEGEKDDDDIGYSRLEKGKGKQRKGSLADVQNLPIHARSPTAMAPAKLRPEKFAVRGFQGKSRAATYCAPLAAGYASGSSQPNSSS